MPAVTVVIPTYNRPKLLRETLASVAAQTFRDYEVLVIDDESTVPGIEEVCAGFKQCRYIRVNHGGRSAARNRGIEEATGDHIAFLDDDDLWEAEKLERQVAFMAAHPETGLVHCPVAVIDANGNPTGEVLGDVNPEWRAGNVFPHAVRHCVVKSPTPLIRRELFDQVDHFNLELNAMEDHDMWARLAYVTPFGHIPEPLAKYRVHDGSHTLSETYLNNTPLVADALCRFVDPADRRFVRHELSLLQLRQIHLATQLSASRRRQYLKGVLTTWPAALLTRTAWEILLGKAPASREPATS